MSAPVGDELDRRTSGETLAKFPAAPEVEWPARDLDLDEITAHEAVLARVKEGLENLENSPHPARASGLTADDVEVLRPTVERLGAAAPPGAGFSFFATRESAAAARSA